MTRLVAAFVALAIGAQIVYPLVTGEARDVVTVAVVSALTAAALTHAVVARGWRWALVLFVTTAGLGLLSEIVGTATGFPFGSYFYATDRLGPDVIGVPAVVPLAWTAGFYPIWCAVGHVLEKSARSRRVPLQRIVMTAVGMVGWDLYLDTQMVTDGQWTWTSGIAGLPGLPSIPVSNYLGWLALSLVMATVVEHAGRRVEQRNTALTDTAPLVLFLWTWLGSCLAHSVFLVGPELRYSAVYGLVAMGVVGVPLLLTWIGQSRRGRATPPHTTPPVGTPPSHPS